MKRMLFTIVAAAVSLCAFTGAANAQTSLDLRAQVPFSFVADGHVLSAGEYEITQLRPSLIALHNLDDKQSALALSVRGDRDKASSGSPALIFHRYGDQYFLAQVIPNDVDDARQLPATRAEKKLIKQQGKPQLAVIRVSSDNHGD